MSREGARTQPYFCPWCMKRSPFPLPHKTLGYICQHCLRPFGPILKPAVLPDLSVFASRPVERKRKPRKGVSNRARRRRVAERDGWICQLCRHPVDQRLGSDHPHRASVDHIIRQRDGGSNALENLRFAHQSCNEYREGAMVTPFAPFLREALAA